MKMNRTKIAAAVLAVLIVSSSLPGSASAATAKLSITPARILLFDPPVGDQVIQAFDNGGGKDVFFSQQVGTSTRLSRCTRTSTGKCIQRDSVLLPGYGHGESLEVYSKNGRTYAWVGSNAGATSRFAPARSISLIEYIKAPSGSNKARYRRIGSLIGLAAVAPGASGTPVTAAVALADGCNRLAIRAQVTTSSTSSYYAIYKTAELTALMKKARGQNLSIANARHLMVSQFKEPPRPYNSFQGFDIKGVGTNKKFLYIFGGFAGQAPTIYRFAYTISGKVTKDRTYVIKGSYVGRLEAEGIKVESDPTSGGKERVQLGLTPTARDGAGRLMFRLYRFAE